MTCDKCILSASGVTFSYDGERTILKDVDMCIAPGELLTLLGPNGAGKSTLLNCLAGVCVPESGRVELLGEDIRQMAPRDIAQAIAYVPQQGTSTYGYRVRDYIAMGRAPHKNVFQKPGAQDMDIVDNAIELLGIQKLAEKAYTHLSGGERQLVNVCRALAQQPRIILFDEPTSALDFGNQVKVLRMVKELSQQGYAIVMTTHNPDQPVLLGGRVALLDRSGALKTGKPSSLLTTESLSELYDVDLRVFHSEELGRTVCSSAKL